MVILGIDPGINGGLACLKDGEIIEVLPTPSIGSDIEVSKIIKWLKNLNIERNIFIDLAVIEDVHAIYGSSAKSTFEFGKNLGIVECLVQAFDMPYKKVKPKAWQKISLEGVPMLKKKGKTDTKGRARVAVKRLFPSETFLATPRSRVPHDGVVDAVLIAYSEF